MNNSSNASNVTGAPPFARLFSALQLNILIGYYVILILVTVAGNSLVCLAIYLDGRLRGATNWFIASLAVSDLLYGLVGLPFRVANSSGLSLGLCQFWIWADMCSAAASIANLAAISVDRYLKITGPFVYGERMTTRRSLIAITSVWVYAFALSTVSIVPLGDQGVIIDVNGFCKNNNRFFYMFANIIAFMIPLSILVVSYLMIYRTALKQFRKLDKPAERVDKDREERRKQRRTARDFKATKTLAVVVGTFTICWFPFFLIFTITLYDPLVLLRLPHPWNNASISVFILILPNLNSACNPIIYAYFNSDYRQAFKRIVTSRWGTAKDFNYNRRRRSSVSSFFTSFISHRRNSPNENDLMSGLEAKANGEATV